MSTPEDRQKNEPIEDPLPDASSEDSGQSNHSSGRTLPLVIAGLVLCVLGVGLWKSGLLFHKTTDSNKGDSVPAKLSMKTIECVDYKIPPENFWFNKPLPTPTNHIRETEKYLQWREQFSKSLARLEQSGYKKDAARLRTWFHEFQRAEIARIDKKGPSGALSPLFARPDIRRFIQKPPQPAFEKFFGYKIVLPWEQSVYYYEANQVKPGTQYLLHPNGIFYHGTPLRVRKDLTPIFRQAGIRDRIAQNVLVKVSGVEGGFDAVNTWDTGYVSVGFIQFTTGEGGQGHSLVNVLQRMKNVNGRKSADEFVYYFKRRGIDVAGGRLLVKDPSTSKTLSGNAAVQTIIKDKRLIAVFQNAGAKSRSFQIAQLQEAFGSYYMADKYFRLAMAEVVKDIPGQPEQKSYVYGDEAVRLSAENSAASPNNGPENPDTTAAALPRVTRLPDVVAKYKDILSSEGGMVTLTDRAVQLGVKNAEETFVKSLAEVAGSAPLVVSDFKPNEALLIQKIKNRIDVQASRRPPVPSVVPEKRTENPDSQIAQKP